MATGRQVGASTQILQLKIELLETNPPVWRRVVVPSNLTLAGLHVVVQAAMGWEDAHLHMFEVGGLRYMEPDPHGGPDEAVDESSVTLADVVREGDHLLYTYDFGDDWEHDITVEQLSVPEPGTQYPRCIGGAQACPPEDVGGPWGYEGFLAALADPAHEEHQDMRDWIDREYDPATFDSVVADERLVPLRARLSRPGARAGGTPGSG